jgi:hypothetical protein
MTSSCSHRMNLDGFKRCRHGLLQCLTNPTETDRWVSGGSALRYRWDYAFLKAMRTRPETPKDSYFGLKIDLPFTTWEAIGYPENYGNNQVMCKVSGKRGPDTTTAEVQMLGNPMRSGNSGGAWHVGGWAIGLNSIHARDATDEWSPYFDKSVTELWNKVHDGCVN